jgi:hypothetical protein
MRLSEPEISLPLSTGRGADDEHVLGSEALGGGGADAAARPGDDRDEVAQCVISLRFAL